MRITALFTSALGVLLMYLGVLLADWIFAPRFRPEFENWYVRSLEKLRLARLSLGRANSFRRWTARIGLLDFLRIVADAGSGLVRWNSFAPAALN